MNKCNRILKYTIINIWIRHDIRHMECKGLYRASSDSLCGRRYYYILLSSILGRLTSFSSELIWNYRSYRQLGGLFARRIATYTEHKKNAERHPCFESEWNHDPSVRADEDSSYLRPCGRPFHSSVAAQVQGMWDLWWTVWQLGKFSLWVLQLPLSCSHSICNSVERCPWETYQSLGYFRISKYFMEPKDALSSHHLPSGSFLLAYPSTSCMHFSTICATCSSHLTLKLVILIGEV